MPFDTAAQSIVITAAGQAPGKRTDVTIGVVGRDGTWRVYAMAGRPAAYDTREAALAAAEAQALAAAREGLRVELFVQEPDGAFRQTIIGLH